MQQADGLADGYRREICTGAHGGGGGGTPALSGGPAIRFIGTRSKTF